MKKIKTTKVSMGQKSVKVEIYELDQNESLSRPSRVYVWLKNSSDEIALIFNSKRGIWGFPGGHTEEGETVMETAKRECVEEVEYSIKDGEAKYALVNSLDDEQKETQIICFANVDKKSNAFQDENESVSKVKFVPLNKVLDEVGNKNLWVPILEGFKHWSKN